MELHYLFLLPLLVILFLYLNPSRTKNPTKPSPLKPYPLLGNLPQFIANRHRFLEWTTELLLRSQTHTFVVQIPGDVSGIFTADPANLAHILKHNFHNYPKGDRITSVLRDFLGRGIFNADGHHWRRQRKSASFEFNKRSLRDFAVDAVGHEITGRLIPLLAAAAAQRETVVELQEVFERFAFDNICQVAFGEDPACLGGDRYSDELMTAFAEAQILSNLRFRDPLPFLWRIKKRFDVGSERRLRESISVVDEFAMKIIRSRKEKIPLDQHHHDLLSRFASDADNTDEDLRDMAVSFIVAGRETTSSALTWFFWLLSSRPDVEERILAEINSIRKLRNYDSDEFSFDELREMNYLHAAISESMRLYPPVPIDSTSCEADDVLPDGTRVGKGWIVSYSAYTMGRMEEIWGDGCGEYKPERWLEENGAFRPESPFRYPVFHAGPRMCLGKEMAYIQMKSIVASVLERFVVETVVPAVKGKVPEHLLSLTMRMKGGLKVRVRDRNRDIRRGEVFDVVN